MKQLFLSVCLFFAIGPHVYAQNLPASMMQEKDFRGLIAAAKSDDEAVSLLAEACRDF